MDWESAREYTGMMECTYRPRLGQVVLIEGTLTDPDRVPASAIVAGVVGTAVILELTCSSSAPPDGSRIVSSHFAPEALYRMTATVRALEPGFVRLEDCDLLETVQRRRWPRRTVSIPVTLVVADAASPQGIRGETVDIGIGGALVRTDAPLPAGADPLLAIAMPDSETMLIEARMVGADTSGDHAQYRLAFVELDDVETARLADLMHRTPDLAGARP